MILSNSLRIIRHQPLTMYKNNSQFSSKFKGCSPLQLSCNLTGMKPAIGYYSYTNRCVQLNMDKADNLFFKMGDYVDHLNFHLNEVFN